MGAKLNITVEVTKPGERGVYGQKVSALYTEKEVGVHMSVYGNGHLIVEGQMGPADAESFISALAAGGLDYLHWGDFDGVIEFWEDAKDDLRRAVQKSLSDSVEMLAKRKAEFDRMGAFE